MHMRQEIITNAAIFLVGLVLGSAGLVWAAGAVIMPRGDVVQPRGEQPARLTVAVVEVVPVEQPLPPQVVLNVPYIAEAPDGQWVGNWKNACEEAVVAMVEAFHQNKKTVTAAESKQLMQELFDYQNKRWGSNANSDAARTAAIVEALGLFKVSVQENPTIEAIKKEIAAGRPIISLHRGFDLGNKNIPFVPIGSSYHTLVLVGFDDATGEFITHDPGDLTGGEFRHYAYTTLMASLHDYSFTTNQADGPARVLFTAPK
jgi:hypothetical protein